MTHDIEKLAGGLTARVGSLFSEIAEIPQIKRGKVWCHQCGREQRAGAECFRIGWPKCCGATMSIDTPEDRRTHLQGEKKQ